jgi:hypothetical protein
VLLWSTASLNEARRVLSFGAFGNPSRRFYRERSRDILTTDSDGKVDLFEFPRKHSGVRTHLKMINQPSGALEYDAVGVIDNKFREAVSYNMYEMIVLRLYGMWHLPREVKRTYGHTTPKHIHDLHWQI